MADILKTHGDLTDLQIADIQKALIARTAEEDIFGQFFEDRQWEDGYTTLEYKRLIIDPTHKEDVKPLVEGVAPTPLKMTVATFKIKCEDYADVIYYTDKSKKYSFNDVTGDAIDTLGVKRNEKINFVFGKPLYNSRCTLTAPTTINAESLLRLFGTASTVLKKNHVKPFNGGNFKALITPEVELLLLLNVKDLIKYNSEKEAIIKGYIGTFMGFDIVSVATELADTATGKQTIAFMGITEQGKKPGLRYKNPNPQIFNNPLGSGVVPNGNGDLVADAAHQVGSVAYKDMGLAATLNDDFAVLNCTLTVESIGASNLATSGRTDFVSESTTPKNTPTT